MLCSQNFDRIMASPTPPSGSLSGFIDDGNNAGVEDVSGLSPRPPGLMYADLQVIMNYRVIDAQSKTSASLSFPNQSTPAR